MTEQKKATKRGTTIGQRVPADVRTKFNDFAKKKMKCTAAELLRALMEATYSGNAKTGKKELTVNVVVGKGVVGSEVVSKLDEILSRLTGKAIAEATTNDPEPVGLLAEEVGPSPDILDQISAPKKQPKVDEWGNIILNATAQNFGLVKVHGAKFNGNANPKYWYIPKDKIAEADMKFFEEWLA